MTSRASLVAQMVKSMTTMWETWVRSLSWEDPLEKGTTPSSILAWKIPWTEETGGLYLIGSQRVRHDWVHTYTDAKPETSWQIDGEKLETVTDFIFLVLKITEDCDCSHEIQRHLLLGRKAMTNLDSVLKSETPLCWQRSV